MKRNLYTLAAAFVVLFSQYAYCGTYGGGLGTAAEPYIIADPNHVQQIGENSHHWNRCFILTEDIDMAACNGTSFHIIGTDYARPFNGVFDGDGHIISNLTIDTTGTSIKYLGFFGCVGSGAEVKNLVMENVNVNGGNSTRNAGGLAGQNIGSIMWCSTSGTVSNAATGWAYTGGLIGLNSGQSGPGIIFDCHSSCDITTGGKMGGGLIGYAVGGTISNCSASGSVSGYSYLGGLMGSIATQTAASHIGIVENCFSTGDVSGHDRIGGFMGESGSSLVKNCYSTGNATGTEIVGGFMGTNYFYPYDGYGDAIIENCYSMGKVTAGSQKGGFVGRHWNQPVRVNNSFWDTQTSGISYSSGGQGKTTAQMQVESTFTSHGWNFSGSDPNNPEGIWYMETYPVLQWEVSPLQAQIDAAVDGDIITVEPGEYRGRLNFKGKNITLVSTDPTNSDVVAATVLDGGGLGAVVTFDGSEDESCVLNGFTITGGNTTTFGGGVFGNGCLATLKNCVIEGNQVVGASGGGIWGLNGLIENCVIRDNSAASGSGLTKCNGVIRNCLIVNNLGGTLRKCSGTIINCTIVGQSEDLVATLKACNGLFENSIMQPGAGDLFINSIATTRYCCYPDAAGEEDIDIDPLFVNAADGNYHLLPNSPCIDAGDPASDYSNEPLPNGSRINMGAYGNTSEAARNFQYKLLAADGAERDGFGSSVSIDGDIMISGAPGCDYYGSDSGSAYIFRYNGSSWAQEAKLMAADGTSSDRFGSSVSINGNYAIIGAPEDENRAGSAYVFQYDGSSWTQQAKLTDNDAAAGDEFGKSVSIDGDVAIVGSDHDNAIGTNSGSAHIFRYDGAIWTQEAKLTADYGTGSVYFGVSVSINDNKAIVGAYRESNSGSAYIFHYDGSVWIQQAKLTAADGAAEDRFGNSVSIDGDVVIVGAYGDDDHGSSSGSAYIFRYDGAAWTQQAKLTAADGAAEDRFGNSVSIDGDHAIAGALKDDDLGTDSGSAYIFRYDGAAWIQQAKLTANDGDGQDIFGNSVDVNNGVFVVGARYDEDNGMYSGSVYVFDDRVPSLFIASELSPENYICSGVLGESFSPSAKTYILTNNDGVPLSWTASVSQPWLEISPAEGTLEVGDSATVTVALNASVDSFQIGSHYNKITFTNLTGGIEQTRAVQMDILMPSFKLLAADGATEDRFGNSVSIDGDVVIVGAYGDDDHGDASGSAYIYRYDGSVWIQQAKLTAADGAAEDRFGNSVSIDGDVVIVGAYGDDDHGSSSGSVYIFRYDGAAWTQQAKLTANDATAGDWFGSSVSINGDVVIIGAYRDDDHEDASGSAYIFHYDGSSWIQEAKLTAADGAAKDYFGISVSIDGNHAIVSAYQDDDHGSNSGSAYIFHYDGSSWSQQAKLTAADATRSDYFGISVSIEGNHAIVGAHYDDALGTDSGSAYIFRYDGATWTQEAKLTASGEQTYFGSSVSIEGNHAIVGATGYGYHGFLPGLAYIFRYDGLSWIQQARVTAEDRIASGRILFGNSVDVSDGLFLIGALWDYDNGSKSGSAYVFRERLEHLSVSGLELVSKERVGRTVFEYTYQLQVSNDHVEPIFDIMITLLPASDNMVVIDGDIFIGQINSGEVLVTDDTITLRVDRAGGPADGKWIIEYGLSPAPIMQGVTFGLYADIVEDGVVNEKDLVRMMQSWLTSDAVADIAPVAEPDGIVNLLDFQILSSEWE